MSMYINRQSDEIRRLSERNDYLEGVNTSLLLAEEAAYRVCEEYQTLYFHARRMNYFWALACGVLAVGWLLS